MMIYKTWLTIIKFPTDIYVLANMVRIESRLAKTIL